MNHDSRLNLLLTHGQPSTGAPAAVLDREPCPKPPWYRSLSTLLAPMGVRTFEATTGYEAMAVIEKNPIHLAVVDTRLSGTDELSLPKLIQKIREQNMTPPMEQTAACRVQVQITQPGQPRIEVKIEAQISSDWPTIILLTPARNDHMLAEALRANVFSVVHEPVDVNLMLEMMARAMKRFHQNQWPQ